MYFKTSSIIAQCMLIGSTVLCLAAEDKPAWNFDISGFADVQAQWLEADDDTSFLVNDGAVYISTKTGAYELFIDLPFFSGENGDDLDFASGKSQVYLAGEHQNGVSWQFGQFDTVLGFESNDTLNLPLTNASVFVSAALPTLHKGILLGYAPNDRMTMQVLVADADDSGSPDGNELDAGGVLSWSNTALDGYVAYVSQGKEVGDRRGLLDFVVGKKLGAVELNLEATLVDPPVGDSGWGVLVYADYARRDSLYYTLRLERVDQQEDLDEAHAAAIGIRFLPAKRLVFKLDYVYTSARDTFTQIKTNGHGVNFAGVLSF